MSSCKQHFYCLNGLAYFWRTKHKQKTKNSAIPWILCTFPGTETLIGYIFFQKLFTNTIRILHSVPRIVALITMRVNRGAQALSKPLRLYFNRCALIFFKFLWLKNRVNQLNTQTKFWYQYFWLWRPSTILDTHDSTSFYYQYSCRSNVKRREILRLKRIQHLEKVLSKLKKFTPLPHRIAEAEKNEISKNESKLRCGC